MSAKLYYGFNLNKEEWPYLTFSENEYTKWYNQLIKERWFYHGDVADIFGIVIAESIGVSRVNMQKGETNLEDIMTNSFKDYFPNSKQYPDYYLIYD